MQKIIWFSNIWYSWILTKNKLKKSSFKQIQKKTKLENLKIVKYLCCTICFQIDSQCIRYCLLHTMLQSTSTWQTSIDDSSFGGGGVAYSGGWIYCWNLQDEWPTWAQFAVNIINHIGHRVIQKHLVVVMVGIIHIGILLSTTPFFRSQNRSFNSSWIIYEYL